MTPSAASSPLLRPVLPSVLAFPPNRDTLGGTAYLILTDSGNILVDCPAWNDATAGLLQAQPVRWLFLTHRGAIGKVKAIQQACQCEVVMQEQEAYLLPNLEVTTFQHEVRLTPETIAFWTSGHSPGSACLYDRRQGGILFTGRHLLPTAEGEVLPLRLSKTFHWRRQLESVEKLRDRFSPETLNYLCPGANLGFLRGQRSIDQAYAKLGAIDLAALATAGEGAEDG